MPTLAELHEIVESLDPMSGPNIQRYIAQNFTDNGDGTMTILKRHLPYEPDKAEIPTLPLDSPKDSI